MRKLKEDSIAKEDPIVVDTLDDIGDQDTDYSDDQHAAANDALDGLGGDVTIDLTIVA